MHIDPSLIKALGPKGLVLKENVINFVENSKTTSGISEGKTEVNRRPKAKRLVRPVLGPLDSL